MKLISARSSRAPGAHQHREARARHLRRPLEVEDPERGADVPVRLRLEVERRGARRDGAPRRCPRRSAPTGTRRVREVRYGHQQVVALLLDVFERRFELLDLLSARLVRGEHVRRIEPLLLRARDFLARRVLLALQISRLRGSARGASRRARRTARGSAVGVEAAVRQAGSHFVDVVAHIGGVEHGALNPIPGHREAELGSIAVTMPQKLRPQGRVPRRGSWHPLPARPPRRSPRRCCRSSTSRSSSTASRRRVASGVDNIILVTGRGKNAIEDHFDVSVELETFLEARGKTELLAEIRKISNLINVSYVRQGEPLGLGHAVLVTQDARRRRALRGHPRRRRDRRGSAGAAPDDRRVRGSGRTGPRDRGSPEGERQRLRHHRRRRSAAGRLPDPRPRREAAARPRRRRTSRSSAATSSRPTSSRRSRRRRRTGPARSS